MTTSCLFITTPFYYCKKVLFNVFILQHYLQALTLGLGSHCARHCNVTPKEDLPSQRIITAGSPVTSQPGYPQKQQPCLFPQVLNPDFFPPVLVLTQTATPTTLAASCSHYELAQERVRKAMLPPSITPLFFSCPGTRALNQTHKTDGCNPPNQLPLREISLCPPSKTAVSYLLWPLHFPSAGVLCAQKHGGISQSMP